MGKNKYIGKWTETGENSIHMPFTYENLQMLLCKIVSKQGSELSHQDFVNWCEEFYWYIEENNSSNIYDIKYKILAKTLNDISAQWDLYLVNTYSLEELQGLDFSKIELPFEWFENWLKIVCNKG